MKETDSYISSIEKTLTELQIEAKDKQVENELTVKEANLVLTGILNSVVKVDESKRTIKVWCSQDRISIRYIVDKEKQNSADIEINIAKKYDVMDYGNVVKPNAKKNNIKENDIHQIRLSPFGIDVLKNGGSDIDELFEYSTLCQFIAKSFKENGEFFQKAKGFYEILYSQWEYISDLYNRTSSISHERKKVLVNKYIQEFTDNKIMTEGNIVVIKNKRTDFHTLTAYQLDSVKTKYFTGVRFCVEIKSDWIHSKKDERIDRYHLALGSSPQKGSDIKSFINNIAEWKYTGEQIEVYTLEEWKMYEEMIKNENVNIMGGTDSKHYNDKSKYYEELYYNRK